MKCLVGPIKTCRIKKMFHFIVSDQMKEDEKGRTWGNEKHTQKCH